MTGGLAVLHQSGGAANAVMISASRMPGISFFWGRGIACFVLQALDQKAVGDFGLLPRSYS